MNYTFEDFKKEVFTAIERMTEDVDSLDGFDNKVDNWWTGEKEIQIDYDDCIAWVKCYMELRSDWEECFGRGVIDVFEGGTIALVSEDEYEFTEAEQQELSNYLTW